jgi:nitroreductase
MTRETLLRILDLARWAPSGDNTQPWRFEIVADDHVVVHGFDTRDHCVYDFDGRPSQMAIGALLENMAIAASANSLAAEALRQADSPDTAPRFDVQLSSAPNAQPDPLAEHIPTRSVQRRPLSTRQLTPAEKSALESAVGATFRVKWFEGLADRSKVARLLWTSAHIRLTIPEAYAVHRSVIAWGTRFSEDRVPDQAIGLDPLAIKLMAWVMKSWERVEFFNTYLGGTILPRVQLDFLPGLMCAAHFALIANERPTSIEDFVAAGRAMQRFWLTASRLGLQLQPEMTPLIFSSYARQGTRFSQTATAIETSRAIDRRFAALLGEEQSRLATFFGRIGHGKVAAARSTRLPLEKLMISKEGKGDALAARDDAAARQARQSV